MADYSPPCAQVSMPEARRGRSTHLAPHRARRVLARGQSAGGLVRRRPDRRSRAPMDVVRTATRGLRSPGYRSIVRSQLRRSGRCVSCNRLHDCADLHINHVELRSRGTRNLKKCSSCSVVQRSRVLHISWADAFDCGFRARSCCCFAREPILSNREARRFGDLRQA